MDEAADIATRTQRFNEAARTFTPPSPSRHAKLAPFKDGIVELRQKGASLRLIRELLATVDVAVGTDTIARFLAEVNGDPIPQRAAKRTGRQRAAASGSIRTSIASSRQVRQCRRSQEHPFELPRSRRNPTHPRSVHAYAALALPIRATSDQAPSMTKQINLVINGKGGVGKSFFATNFVQYLKDCGIAHCAIDSDHENSTLKRFHPDSEFINLEHRREIDRMFTTAETADLLVIDCRAASTDLFIDFFDEVGFAEVLRAHSTRD